ncbi:hypothetical protein HK100_004503 [Physocladia obscura]|uniref:EF-hand domain-containing protein n=1 Tax=Physocladia obscura TaxID=109957 RepID=A0AAD5T690_9FUNG|nr:hypothetical protein HK100_004503 [Physocladia obscura]
MNETEPKTALTEQQIADLKLAFTLFDTDGDGTISVPELQSLLTGLGAATGSKGQTNKPLTFAQTEKIMRSIDANANGVLEFDEFVVLMTSAKQKSKSFLDKQTELLNAFKVFDLDGDGFITHDELAHVLKNLGNKMTNEDIDDMLLAADVNGDGVIDYTEFLHMMS